MGAKFSTEIQESKDSRGTDLVLRNGEQLNKKIITALLEDLPKELPQLSALTFANCRVKALPSSFWQSLSNLEHLTSLNLEDNNITEMPDESATRSKLKELILAGNKLSDMQPKLLTRLSCLDTLDFSNNNIKKITGDLGNSALANVRLAKNELTEISLSLCFILGLQRLDLSFNMINSISASIVKLKNLIDLDLSHNKIKEVPKEIGELTQLVHLDLSANEISKLPATISGLVNLRSLRLQHCKFTEFPAVIGSLDSVEILMLNDNRITCIPSEISNMQSLIDLHLQENLLTSLPNELGQIISLRRLFLEFNRISSIPRDILDLKMLLQLNLHHNELTSCPLFLKNLKSLLRFNIDNNPLDETGEANKNELMDILYERDVAISTPTVRIKTSSFAATKSDSDTGLSSKNSRPFALRQNSRSLVSIQEMLGREAKEDLLPFRSASRKNTDASGILSVASNPEIYVSSTTSSPEGTMTSERTGTPSSSTRRVPESLSPFLSYESPKLRTSESNSHARDHAPNYSKFREPFEAMMEEQGYTKERQEVLSKLTNEQKWALLKDRKPYVPQLLKQDTGRKSRAFNVTKQQQKNKPGDYTLILQRGRVVKEDLTQLLSQLRQNNDSFCVLFIESGGLDALLRIIEDKSVMVKPAKEQKPDAVLLEALRCFCTILETQTSVVISMFEAISIVGLHYDSQDDEISVIVLRIFEEVSQLSRVGRELVMEAIRHHNRWKWRETSQRPQPLSTIASLLSNAITTGRTSLVHTILFTMNRILSEEQDLETRFDLRNTLINLGILHLFTKIKSLEFTPHDTEAITQQVDSFESDLFADEEDMIEKYGKNVVYERKQKETTKQGNFMFVTDLNRPGAPTAIFPYDPETKASTLLADTLSYFQAVLSPKIEYGLFIPSEGKGYWLDCTQDISSHNLKGQIYVEFSMKSLTMDVINVNTQERKEFVLTPGSEVAKIVRMLIKDGFQTQVCTTDKMDSYGLYIPNMIYQAPTSGQMTVNEIGQLLDNTKRLAQYMDQILMSGADHLQLKLKPVIVKVLLPGDNFSTYYFTPDVPVKTVKKNNTHYTSERRFRGGLRTEHCWNAAQYSFF